MLLLLFTLWIPRPAAADVDSPTIAAAAPHPLALDPLRADDAWNLGRLNTAQMTNITRRQNADQSTSVWLLYDGTNIYVSFHCSQSGTHVTATQVTDDVGFGIDDFVGIGLDPSGNGTQVYYFEVTPRGVRLELTRFRGYFPSYGERIHHGKAPYIPAGVPA
ncbi:MAG TPA: hypothetical protein VME66_03540 [Candidatus Acidoferrales bacterium]|nr:hypothetical protein [Candidatus Acidoferrales bacterium]